MTLNKEELIKQLNKLVAFRSVSGNTNANAKALDYIETLISPAAKVERIKNGQAEILLASNSNVKNPDYGFMAHVDVVAASDQLFTMTQEGAILRGRGVSDMKFSIPLGVALLNELIETKNKISFTLAITTDEETGGFEGAAFLAGDLEWRPKVLIVPDGGDDLKFVNKAKGMAQFMITSTGASAHGARPWLGKNALLPLAKIVVELESRYGKNSLKENWNTTLNFGRITGGSATNQVCDYAELALDFRYPETDSIERIEDELKTLMVKIEPTLKIERLSTGLPTFTETSLPVVQRFLKCLKDEFSQEIPLEPTYGTSDSRYFSSFGIPVLMSKPCGGDIHCETEWLVVDSTMIYYQAMRKFVLG